MSSFSGYALWPAVLVNSLIVIFFAVSFTQPRTSREWRSFGAFSAFIIALFTEMYGFPLTIYLLSGWLGHRYPGLDLYSHNAGHLWYTLLNLKGDPHDNPVHLFSNLLILGGLIILFSAWRVLHKAQRKHEMANTACTLTYVILNTLRLSWSCLDFWCSGQPY